MEKSVIIIYMFCICLAATAQDSIYVHSVQGTVLQTTTSWQNSLSPIYKGGLITQHTLLDLKNNSSLSAISKKGDVYTIKGPGRFKTSHLLKNKQGHNPDNLTQKYFAYIWKEFMGHADSQTRIGGVFRGTKLMQLPQDSSYIAGNRIDFSWKNDDTGDDYYIIFLNTTTHEMLKVSSSNTLLSLYKDSDFLKNGMTYSWTVTKNEFADLDNLTYNLFTLIDRNTYQDLLTSTYGNKVSELKKAGLTSLEINKIICDTYGLCK